LTLTGDKGVDVVYDPVGLVDLSIKCIAHFGKLLVVGFAGGAIEKIAMNRVLLKQVSLIGYVSAIVACQPRRLPSLTLKAFWREPPERSCRGGPALGRPAAPYRRRENRSCGLRS
jgi:NADPH:quinone reductase-like Zn-dependent oxidoreductase